MQHIADAEIAPDLLHIDGLAFVLEGRVGGDHERTRHVRFNQLDDPEPIPKDTDYASVLESDVPVAVQHTRLDSRQAELALISTLAFAG